MNGSISCINGSIACINGSFASMNGSTASKKGGSAHQGRDIDGHGIARALADSGAGVGRRRRRSGADLVSLLHEEADAIGADRRRTCYGVATYATSVSSSTLHTA
eukprot:3257110-Rhodomonas_salina.1